MDLRPDGGLFSSRELRKHGSEASAFPHRKPERGVIEVKALDTDLSAFESSGQVLDYLAHYGQVLLTNYRAFALWSWKGGKAVRGEHYTIAPNEKEFWEKVHLLRRDPGHPEHDRIWEFLPSSRFTTSSTGTTALVFRASPEFDWRQESIQFSCFGIGILIDFSGYGLWPCLVSIQNLFMMAGQWVPTSSTS